MEGKLEGKKYRLIVEPIEQEGQTPPEVDDELRGPHTCDGFVVIGFVGDGDCFTLLHDVNLAQIGAILSTNRILRKAATLATVFGDIGKITHEDPDE